MHISRLSAMFFLAVILLGTSAAVPCSRAEEAKKRIVFVHGPASHGYGGHAYGPAFRMLAEMLNEGVPAVNAVVFASDHDLSSLEQADAIVLGSDGGELVKQLADRLEPLMERGVGLACIHYTLDPGDPNAVRRLVDWIGGAYEQHWSINPFWEAEFTRFPDHPAAHGLQPFRVTDEWYYHMRFREGMQGVTPILEAVPPESTRQRPDGPHSGNPTVRRERECRKWWRGSMNVPAAGADSASPACIPIGPGPRTAFARVSSTPWSGSPARKFPTAASHPGGRPWRTSNRTSANRGPPTSTRKRSAAKSNT